MYFCSSKCRRNAINLKRDNKKVNWVRKAGVNETTESFEVSERKETKTEKKEAVKKEELVKSEKKEEKVEKKEAPKKEEEK